MEIIYRPIIESVDENSFLDNARNGLYSLFGFAIYDYLCIKQLDPETCTYDDIRNLLGDDKVCAICLTDKFDPDEIISVIETHPASIYIIDFYCLTIRDDYETFRPLLVRVEDYLDSHYYNMHSYENRMAYCIE